MYYNKIIYLFVINLIKISENPKLFRILIVDDEILNIWVLKELIKMINPYFIIEEATNGEMALNKMR
jgi:CheY-like chemotaxis protein